MKKERKVAFRAALEAGAILKEHLGTVSINYKSAFNLVTDADKAAEKQILEILKSEFSHDAILAEESGASQGMVERRWIIDPLDGTTNFAHRYPFFAVSIGLEQEGEMILGVVYNPTTDEMFWAEKDGGAWLNDDRIKVSMVDKLEESLLSTGFPPDTRGTSSDNMNEFTRLTSISHGVRRDGSAALDLAFVAAGRTEGFWEMKLSAWDVAAGSLIVREAGGKVTNLEGGPLDIDSGHIIATNGLIHDEIVTQVASLKASL